jgi:hypothetical protein
VQPDEVMPGPGTAGPPWPPPASWDQGQSWPSYWVPPGAALERAWAPPPGPSGSPGPPGPQGYQPVPSGPMPIAPPNEPMATGAMITGVTSLAVNLFGWVFGWLFLGPVVWLVGLAGAIAGIVMARVAKRRIAESGGALGGDPMVTAGLVTSIIAAVLAAIGLLITLVVLVIFGVLIAASG